MACINPNSPEFKAALQRTGNPLLAEIEVSEAAATPSIKPGVAELFQENPELASIGTPEQYSQYLDTIFPESKVKDIVYHGTTATFEKFMKMYNNIHFGTLKAAKERLATIKNQRKSSNENIYPVILDIKRPIITDADFDWELDSAGEQPDPYELIKTVGYLDNWLYQNGYLPKEESDIFGLPDKSIPERVALWKNHDSYIYKNFVEDKGSKSYSIFEPEQIHILGGKQDVEGFRKFVSGAAPSAMFQLEGELETSAVKPRVEEFYQVTSKEIESADKKLDEYLIDFLKPFGVTTKEVEALKNRLGEDSLGIADVINKVITVTKNRKIDTIPEEAGHMITMLMGENHPEIKALLNSIDKWSGYKAVYDEYWDRYYNEKQIKIEAVGKVIAKALVQKFKEQDVSIFNQAKKVISSFFAILSRISPFKTSFYTYHLADKIATNILLGNTSYVANITPSQSRLNYKKTIDENPFGKYIIDTFTERFGFSLTGSLAIAGQGEVIYRPETEPIHDLDFVVEDKNKMKDVAKFLEESNAIPLHHGIKGDDYITLSYYIPKKGFTVEPSKVTNYGFVSEIQLKNEKGEYVEPTAQNVIGVDFFVYNAISKERKPTSIFSSWQDIYKGKLVLSPLKSGERMFRRPKDQIDYILSVPVEREYQLPEFTYLQTEEVPASTASPETIGKVKKLLEKMGVSVKDLATYVKEAGLTNVKGVNGVADLTRRIIAIAEGKEDVALTEEMVHIATAIIEQKNPKLVTEMISKIDRFKIYKQVYEQYKDVYKLPNGKPDIRKIKKEAVDKLITEIIVNKNEGNEQNPELLEENTQLTVRNWWNTILDWIRGMYRKANISVFEEAASKILAGEIEGVAADITATGVMFQLTDKQQAILKKLEETDNSIEKVVEQETKDPILMDSEEANNYYRMKNTLEKISKRVTDRVKKWYKEKFPGKQFTKEEKAFNELKRKFGVQGHKDFEDIHARYYHEDGTKRTTPLARPTAFNNLSEDMYDKLENYYVDLIKMFPEGTIIKSEVLIYDPKEREAGTVDFLAIEPSGKGHILDWKFMHIAGDDVAWFKQGAFDIQLGRYKKILRENYGIKEFGMTRAIPISMSFKMVDKNIPEAGYTLKGIAIGSADPRMIEDVKLIPISEETESTGYEALDEIIKKLNGLLAQIAKEEITDEQSREFKIERLNTLRKAIRQAQGRLNIDPLIDVIEVMRKEGDRILNDYNAIYKDRPASSKDSQNSELSDFADDMNNYIKLSDIFTNIARQIGGLIYKPGMVEEAKTKAEQADAVRRRDTLNRLRAESDAIYESREAIVKASMLFADKHIGERNLTTGLLKPEKVLKGLASLFRGAAELPLKSLEVLTKLTGAAQSKAASDSLEEVTKLMEIRKRIFEKGGDIRRYVQQIYQKDDKGKIVNKLIHKYSKAFHDTVDEKHAKGGDLAWLNANIDMEGYRKEADEVMKRKIKNIEKNRYSGSAEEEKKIKDKLIEKVKRDFDIDHPDFSGWNNYIIKRHPLEKWYSEEYKKVMADKDLLELYNFIVKFNEKANDVGYIQNQLTKTFLPFIRKSMAEELVWDNRLSVMDNFYKSLKLNPDDTGYGEFNKVTGELENSVPKYYTYDFTYKDGVNDYSEVSEDLFKNLILYIQQVNKYKYLTEVEGQLKLVKTIEEFKDHLAVDRSNNVVMVGDKPQKIKGNEENAKMFDDFLRVILYEQKYVLSDADVPLNIDKVINFVKKTVNKATGREIWKPNETPSATSLIKTIDAANRAFQIKTLGLEMISGAVNAFGGNIQVATQAGNYFKAREFAANEAKLSLQRFESEEDKEIFVQLINTFMPLKDDPSYELYKSAGMSSLTRGSLGDTLFFFMRKPEILIEKSIFLSLLQNTMVMDGKIVSIREYVKSKYKDRYKSSAKYNEVKDKIENEIEELKKTKSIAITRKLENGKLVIPGLDLNNREELQRLTNLSRRIAANATGAITKENINRMSMSVWTKSMMVFKNWIPKLADTRFGEFRKVVDDFSVRIDEEGVSGEKYDVGRIRLLFYFLGDGLITGATNLKNILYLNDAGIERLDEAFEDFRKKYEAETGEPLNMSREDFIDLIRTNVRNQIKELLILASLMGMSLSLGFMVPDDDEDKATKNLHRYGERVVDKFLSELMFFYNPAELESVLSGGIFPAVGLAGDFSRFMKHFIMETTGMDMDPSTTYEETKKKAQPVKNLMKMFPVTKSLVTYLAIFNEEFAKEYDVTIQKENRR